MSRIAAIIKAHQGAIKAALTGDESLDDSTLIKGDGSTLATLHETVAQNVKDIADANAKIETLQSQVDSLREVVEN